jgi:hypothetical protein
MSNSKLFAGHKISFINKNIVCGHGRKQNIVLQFLWIFLSTFPPINSKNCRFGSSFTINFNTLKKSEKITAGRQFDSWMK